jgi:hypothetical protein
LAGQVAEAPVQYSAASHPPATAARQRVPEGFKASAGQAAEAPVQYSATSHPPATAARQRVPEDFKALAGQGDVVPLHVSAASQSPAAARQIVPEGFGVFEQVPSVVLQTSVVHRLPSSQSRFVRQSTPLQSPPQHSSLTVKGSPSSHGVPSDTSTSTGQIAEVPVHSSAASHWSNGARQIVVGG